ncbi:MAG: hypothetical protein JRI62_00685 [Deltaproteobacteria bacterium]|nr:hypothetical protein [Deltaproteobacteria bacterium]
MTTTWIPEQKLENYLSEASPIVFSSSDVKEFVKYGFRRIKATVSNTGTITFGNKKYFVASGAENFSRHKSTKVYISCFADKLFVFEYKDDGLLLGEALCQQPFEKPVYPEHKIESNEVELIAKFLEQQGMVIERVSLIEKKNNGLTLVATKEIYNRNKRRYRNFLLKLNQPREKIGTAMLTKRELHQRQTPNFVSERNL